MSSLPHQHAIPFVEVEQLREAKSIIEQEAAALHHLAGRLDRRFCEAVDLLRNCESRVVVTGIGKAGLIGQKITATLSSTGTPATFLHPVEAVHGDLGCLQAGDILLALSNSGETEEVCRLLPIVQQLQIRVIAVTGSQSSSLGTQADVVLEIGKIREAGCNGLAPSTSTTVMLALGDALALVLSRLKDFTPQQFAVFHPGGSLGAMLTSIGDVMRPKSELRIADEQATIREALVTLHQPGRRAGAVIVVDQQGRLTGIFTDSDLARLLERRRDQELDHAIGAVMTHNPLTLLPQQTLSDAVEILSRRKISELPVVNEDGQPVGLIDITDVIGLMPAESAD